MATFLEVLLSLAVLGGIVWVIKKIIPDNPLIGSGGGG